MTALGWTLIHFCWQATLIALLYAALDQIHATHRTRYLLALATLLAMAATAVGTFQHELSLVRTDHPLPASGYSPAGPLADTLGDALQPALTLPRTDGFLLWLDALWLFGVALLSIRAIGGWLLLRRLVEAADMPVPAPVSAIAERLRLRMGLGAVALRLSLHATGPFAVGLFRSVVVVPVSALAALTPDQFEAVLAHELAHVRRADYFWNLLQTLLETLFFFHPAVWWIGRRLREEREHCCDDMALAACGNPLAYATALCTLETARSPHLALALAGNRPASALRLRVAHILGEPARPSRSAAPLMLAGVAAIGLCALTLQPRARAAVAAPMLFQPLPAAPAAAIEAKRAALPSAPPPGPLVSLATPAPAQPISYEEAMRTAGFDGDRRALFWLEQEGVTPDYVRTIIGLGLGIPDGKQLGILWSHRSGPADLAALRAAGAAPFTLYDFVGYRLFGVSPALIAGLREAGFDDIPPGKLIKLAKEGITPAYAAAAKRARPDLDIWHLIRQHIDEGRGGQAGGG